MEKIIIKVGVDMLEDMKKAWFHPDRRMAGTLTHYVKDLDELRLLFTPKRLALLVEMANWPDEHESVSKLAKKMKRKQAAVSRDLAILEKNGLIQKQKKKQNVIVNGPKQIVIELARSG